MCQAKDGNLTERTAKQKKFVPGVGHYKIEACYDKISRPMKKRG